MRKTYRIVFERDFSVGYTHEEYKRLVQSHVRIVEYRDYSNGVIIKEVIKEGSTGGFFDGWYFNSDRSDCTREEYEAVEERYRRQNLSNEDREKEDICINPSYNCLGCFATSCKFYCEPLGVV